MSRRFDQLSGPHAIRSLFLARVDNAQAVLQRSAFQLRPEVEKILTFFEPLAEGRAIAARVQGDATLNADRTMIQRSWEICCRIRCAIHLRAGLSSFESAPIPMVRWNSLCPTPANRSPPSTYRDCSIASIA
jgi:hypothetical protein